MIWVQPTNDQDLIERMSELAERLEILRRFDEPERVPQKLSAQHDVSDLEERDRRREVKREDRKLSAQEEEAYELKQREAEVEKC